MYQLFQTIHFQKIKNGFFFSFSFSFFENWDFEQGKGGRTSITEMEVGVAVSQVEKIWRVCTALGNIALACSYAPISIDIQVRRKV